MKEPIENILACLGNWNDAREQKPKEGARIVAFCLHRNGVYDIYVGRRCGQKYLHDDYRGYIACVRYWKYAQGAISKHKNEE